MEDVADKQRKPAANYKLRLISSENSRIDKNKKERTISLMRQLLSSNSPPSTIYN